MSRVISFKKVKITKKYDEKEEKAFLISDGYETQVFYEENAEEITKNEALDIIEEKFEDWYFEEILGYGFEYEGVYYEVDDEGKFI